MQNNISQYSYIECHVSLQVAWAPAKGVKDRKYKDFFSVNQGVTYIPWDKLDNDVDLQALSDGGWIDPQTLPPTLQLPQKEGTYTLKYTLNNLGSSRVAGPSFLGGCVFWVLGLGLGLVC